MKVLQIVKTNIGANWAFLQAKWLFDNGIEVITVLPSKDGKMAEKYLSNGMKVVEGDFTLPIKKPWMVPRKIKEINQLVNDVKPNIIHCHFVTNIMMVRIALKKTNIPRLFQVPGPLHLESAFFKRAEILLSNSNDFWAGACKKTSEIYLDFGIPKEKVFLAYYGGYGGKACDDYKEGSNRLHEEYSIPSDKVLVGMVSYFYKPKAHLLQTRGLKGHEDFIDAISIVRKKNPNVLGVIIGGAWGSSSKYVEKVKGYAADKCQGDILFTGFRNDIKDIYKELDVAVHPSHSENLGGAAESLAAGVPTISTNVGGFPDIVLDGETGFTVPAKSCKELANAISKMINNKEVAKKMSSNGKLLVEKKLDINTTGEEILGIYRKILNGVKN